MYESCKERLDLSGDLYKGESLESKPIYTRSNSGYTEENEEPEVDPLQIDDLRTGDVTPAGVRNWCIHKNTQYMPKMEHEVRLKMAKEKNKRLQQNVDFLIQKTIGLENVISRFKTQNSCYHVPTILSMARNTFSPMKVTSIQG